MNVKMAVRLFIASNTPYDFNDFFFHILDVAVVLHYCVYLVLRMNCAVL